MGRIDRIQKRDTPPTQIRKIARQEFSKTNQTTVASSVSLATNPNLVAVPSSPDVTSPDPSISIVAMDEGTTLTSKVTAINFVGAGISASSSSDGTVTVMVNATSAAIIGEDEGTVVETSFTAINFVGGGVTATANGTVLTVTIPGGGGTGTAADYGVDPSAVTQVQNNGNQTIPASTPTTIALGTTVSDVGGHWIASSNTYKVPSNGLYLIVGYVRLDDSTPAGTNVAVGIGNATNGIEYRWDSVGSGSAHRKNLNLSIARVATANEELMLSVYVDGVVASSIEARLTFIELTGSKQAASGGGGSAGTGTVTSFAFTNAQGVTGTVTTPMTTPNLALAFGAFTPTSVQPTGNYLASDGTAGASGTVAGLVVKNGLFVSGTVDFSAYLPKAGGTLTGALIATNQTIRGKFVSNDGTAGKTLTETITNGSDTYVRTFKDGLLVAYTKNGSDVGTSVAYTSQSQAASTV